MSALRDALLKYAPKETVDLPGGLQVEVRSLTLGERNALAVKYAKPDGTMDVEKFHAALVAATAYDPESGERLFADGEVDLVNGCAVGVMEELASAALRVSGLSGNAVDSGKDGS